MAVVAAPAYAGGVGPCTARDGYMGVRSGYREGVVVGQFAPQSLALPETDAFTFRVRPETRQMAKVGEAVQFSFKFLAETVAPSDLIIRLVSGDHAFSRQLDLGSLQVGEWAAFVVELAWQDGWSSDTGLTESEFNYALTRQGLDEVHVVLTRNGTGEQLFQVADVSLSAAAATAQLDRAPHQP